MVSNAQNSNNDDRGVIVRSILLLVALSGLYACASTETTNATSAASADATEGPKTKTVCRREKVTGSRTKGERICKEVPVE